MDICSGGTSRPRGAFEGNKGGTQEGQTEAQSDAKQVLLPNQGPASASRSHVPHTQSSVLS